MEKSMKIMGKAMNAMEKKMRKNIHGKIDFLARLSKGFALHFANPCKPRKKWMNSANQKLQFQIQLFFLPQNVSNSRKKGLKLKNVEKKKSQFQHSWNYQRMVLSEGGRPRKNFFHLTLLAMKFCKTVLVLFCMGGLGGTFNKFPVTRLTMSTFFALSTYCFLG